MSVIHNGIHVPVFRQRWDPQETNWVWFAWDQRLGGASIVTSTWILPDAWTDEETRQDVPVTDEHGDTWHHANGVLISLPADIATGQKYRVTNRVSLSDGRRLDRSVDIIIGDL